MTEGGVDGAGTFHKIPWIDDSRLASLFTREVLSGLVRKELLSPERAERILSWQHTGFNVHSRVRAKTKGEAERVGKYMIRLLLFQERVDYLEFTARVTSHIPDKGQVMVRYYALYANAHRGRSGRQAVFPSPWE